MATYFPTKYDCARDEIIASLPADWWTDQTGDVDAPCGYVFSIVLLTVAEASDALTDPAYPWLRQCADEYAVRATNLVGSFLVTSDERGFVTVQQGTEQEITALFEEAEQSYQEWLGDDDQ